MTIVDKITHGIQNRANEAYKCTLGGLTTAIKAIKDGLHKCSCVVVPAIIVSMKYVL